MIAAIAFAWLALRQPETLPPERRRAFSPSAIGRAVIEIVRIRAALGYTLATGFVFAPFVAYLSTAQQIFQEAYDTGALFPAYFAVLILAVGGALLVNGRLVMRYGMRRLTSVASLGVALVSIAGWAGAFAFDGLPPLWLFLACLMSVFVCVGFAFGNLSALAMEPLGHLAGVGAAVVSSLSTLIALPLGILRRSALRRHHVRAHHWRSRSPEPPPSPRPRGPGAQPGAPDRALNPASRDRSPGPSAQRHIR